MAEAKTTRPKDSYFYALGRRKSANARVRLSGGKGNIIINNQPAKLYLADSHYLLKELNEPLAVTELANKFDISARVKGGGHSGQVSALKLAITKALIQVNPDLKATLKKADLLSRDSRVKERKKFGLKSARKRRQFTKR